MLKQSANCKKIVKSHYQQLIVCQASVNKITTPNKKMANKQEKAKIKGCLAAAISPTDKEDKEQSNEGPRLYT